MCIWIFVEIFIFSCHTTSMLWKVTFFHLLFVGSSPSTFLVDATLEYVGSERFYVVGEKKGISVFFANRL